MGGAVSKFKQTDWATADGGLTESEDTIDGQPPTHNNGIYSLVKQKYNQREFHVYDQDETLLYTTKVVPGTLCWFDVYSQALGECVLRVQVNLSRRHWIVHRVGAPAFSGQLADLEATERLAEEQRRVCPEITSSPFLFRKCSIVVSWSRYMAVAMQYGAPTDEELLQRMSSSGIASMTSLTSVEGDEDDEDDIFDNASKISSKMRQRNYERSSISSLEEEEEKKDDSPVSLKSNKKKKHPQQNYLYYNHNAASSGDSSNHSLSFTEDDQEEEAEAEGDKVEDPPQTPPTKSRLSWTGRRRSKSNQKSDTKNKEKKKKAGVDPLQGQIDLDHKPLVLCQEIFNRIIGNHQTSRLTKEQAIDLLRKDLKQHAAENNNDNNNSNSEEQPIDNTTTAVIGDDDALFTLEEQRILEQWQPSQQQEEKDEEVSDDTKNLDHDKDELSSNETTTENNDQDQPPNNDAEEEETEVEGEQPLIGYWLWENTLRSHKMKMHLAKGSDLALHVVLAIIVNQVRYERNAAFAMSM